MGRISLYEQSKLPSAVSGYRTSAAPEVAAIESASQSLGNVVNTYVAVNAEKKRKVADIEAQNAFNDFRSSYAGTFSELDQQSKSAPSKGIDMFKEKLQRAKTDFANRSGAGLSDEAKRTYDAMVAQFNEGEGVRLETWAGNARYESVKRETLSGLASSADLAGNADSAQGLLTALPDLDKGVTDFQSTFGGDKRKLLETHRKSAITQHVANRMTNDPKSLVMDLESGAYKDVPEIQSKYNVIWKQAAIAAQEQMYNDEFVGNLKLTQSRDMIAQAIAKGKFDRAAALAEASFAEDGSDEQKALVSALTRPQRFGGLAPAPIHEKRKAGDELMESLAAIGLQKNASKLDRVVAYKALSDKADLMLESGMITGDTQGAIMRVANSLNSGGKKQFAKNIAKIGQDRTAFKTMYRNEDDPLEYVLYRGFDDIGKNKKIDSDILGTTREKYMGHIVRAFEAKYGDDDSYAQIKQKMSDPNFREQLYSSMANAVTDKDGRSIGFNALNRAAADARGVPYVNTYKGKDGKEHKIVASLNATNYIEMTPEMLKSLDTKEK